MLSGVSILDCTLRDGGYVNDWTFGESNVKFILKKLSEAKVDIVECGFFSPHKKSGKDRTIFTDFDSIVAMLPYLPSSTLACMVNYGECELSDIPDNKWGNLVVRVAFHEEDYENAISFCKGLKQKGYGVFVQPMNTIEYATEDLVKMLGLCEEFSPEAVYIVDSFGTLKPDSLIELFNIYEKCLEDNIAIGFHSHNNLQMSFTNSQCLLQQDSKKRVIVDSSVLGMGRGAGNLCTELITMYLNDNFKSRYQIIPILEIVDGCIANIYAKRPWGYSMPYYIASVNHCHPNYATYLVNKQTMGVKAINEVLEKIPSKDKKKFNQKEIEELYISYQNNDVDDSSAIKKIDELTRGRNIFVLAPGKSISEQSMLVKEYIKLHNSLVISVNFLSDDIGADVLFYSNSKRANSIDFNALEKANSPVIATSNVSLRGRNVLEVNYKSLVDTRFDEADNACLMLLRLLKSIGRNNVTIAGFDGFSFNNRNYHSDKASNIVSNEVIDVRNKEISLQLKSLMEDMQIHFLTPSVYVG